MSRSLSKKQRNDDSPLGFKLRSILQEHSDVIYSVAWSPDGYTLASGSADRTIRLWSAQTGQLLHILKGQSEVTSVAWSPNGLILAAGYYDNTIRLWDPKTRRQANILEGHMGSITGASFSHDSSLLISKSIDGTVLLWRT